MRRNTKTLLALIILGPSIGCATMRGKMTDPYAWLEDVDGREALTWVRAQNEATTARLMATPLYPALEADARAVLLAQDRTAFGTMHRGYVYNFWQDATHVKGLVRRTTFAEYRRAHPKWTTILDLDQLASAEGENWVYKGAPWLTKNSSRRLLQLSRGGKDASVVREFDVETKRFVTDGFNLPEAKSVIAGIDRDTVLFATDEGPGSLTRSGYPRLVRRWRRGRPRETAELLLTAEAEDLGVGVEIAHHGDEIYPLVTRSLDFWRRRTYLLEGDRLRALPIPETASLFDVRHRRATIQLKQDAVVAGVTFAAGAVVSCAIDGSELNDVRLIFAPNARQSIERVEVGPDRVVLSLTEDVLGKVVEVKVAPDGTPVERTLDLPKNGVLTYDLADEDDPSAYDRVTFEGYLQPQTSYRVTPRGLDPLKSAPTRFDAARLKVEQAFAISRDGTRVPYSVIGPKDASADGRAPTILYGYGGFEVSLTPYYGGVLGRAWLARGGTFVVANIRGGGEYGPAWHRAALKENRQRAYDDFIAVAEDLHRRQITSPAHLGIQGGSNGGLLTGAVMVQRPELFNAALIQVPLLDMRRYSKLLAGASWVAEYGDPDVPAEWAYISKYSPYQNVRANVRYPTPLFTTSTKDDRVHPAHARKMVARMKALGHDVLYFENVNGGHAGSADLEEHVKMSALEYAYLWDRLR